MTNVEMPNKFTERPAMPTKKFNIAAEWGRPLILFGQPSPARTYTAA